MKTNSMNSSLNNESLDNFIQKLQARDDKSKYRMKRFMLVYTFILVLYIGSTIVNIVKHAPTLAIVNSLIFVIAISIFVFLFRRMFLEQKNVDYSMPLTVVLSDAMKRYKPWRPDLWLAIFAALIVGIPISFSSANYLPVSIESLAQPALIFGIWILVIATAMLVGHLIWRRTKMPLYLSIKSMLNELDESGE